MTNLDGSIISGDVNPETHQFTVTKVKSFKTQSVLKMEQINEICDYLSRATHYDQFHIVNINEQLPVRLNNEEVQLILMDFENVKEGLNI